MDEINKPIPHVLRERNMQWYLGTQLFSLTGLMLRSALLSLLLIDMVGVQKAPPLIGAIWALNVLPGAFLGVFAGLYLDRNDKRRALQITAVLGIVQAGMLAYLAYQGVQTIAVWKIMAIALFGGLTNTIDGIARNALVKDAIIHPSNQKIGSIMFTSLYTIGMVIGTGMAGTLVLTIGYANSFIINGLSFVILLFGLSKMDFSHLEKRAVDTSIGIWKLVRNGVTYTFTHHSIRSCILLSVAITIFGWAYNVILSIIAKTMFGGDPKEYSYLAAIGGIGSLIGSLSAIFWSAKHPKRFIVGGCLIIGVGQILLGFTTNINVAALLLFFCGFGFMASFLPPRGLIMHFVDQKRTGVVLGITFMFFYAGMMVSSFAVGYVAKHFGCPTVLISCGSVLVLIAFIAPRLPGIYEAH